MTKRKSKKVEPRELTITDIFELCSDPKKKVIFIPLSDTCAILKLKKEKSDE